MSIKELAGKIKGWWGKVLEHEKDLFLALLVIVVAIGGFASGRLVEVNEDQVPVRIETVDLSGAGEGGESTSSLITVKTQKGDTFEPAKTPQVAAVAASVSPANGQVVGSKNGSKYHLPECSGAKRIKEENKVWFATVEDAKKAGYTAAANCPGL